VIRSPRLRSASEKQSDGGSQSLRVRGSHDNRTVPVAHTAARRPLRPRCLPPGGGKPKHKVFSSLGPLASTAIRLDKTGHEVYHACASYRERRVWDERKQRYRLRTAENVLMVRSQWIDIDIEQQVLVAYEGPTPTFATLVSTGRNTRESKTPIGIFQIWAKLDFTDMDDLERTDVDKNYAIQDVPWVQFFKGSYGFHAAFWHDDFGRRRSHGCINLSPADARYLFSFTHPVLPPGWNAILPVSADRPTTVQVRDPRSH